MDEYSLKIKSLKEGEVLEIDTLVTQETARRLINVLMQERINQTEAA